MLVGMAIITCIAWASRLQPLPSSIVQWPSLGNAYLSLDFTAYYNNLGTMLPVSLVFLFVSVFDTAGVQGTAAGQAGLLNAEGHLPAKQSTAAFASAAVATCVGALLGSSPIIIHTESGAGIADGARTGLHSVVVAILFLLFIPFVPVLHAIPALVTAPALVIVGSAMMGVSKFIDWQRMDEGAACLPLLYHHRFQFQHCQRSTGGHAGLCGAEGRGEAGGCRGRRRRRRRGAGRGEAADTGEEEVRLHAGRTHLCGREPGAASSVGRVVHQGSREGTGYGAVDHGVLREARASIGEGIDIASHVHHKAFFRSSEHVACCVACHHLTTSSTSPPTLPTPLFAVTPIRACVAPCCRRLRRQTNPVYCTARPTKDVLLWQCEVCGRRQRGCHGAGESPAKWHRSRPG